MKISTELLQDYLSRTMSVREQAEALERAGIEIEQIISSKPLDQNIVVVLVKKVVQHPDADRLRLVTIDDGHVETTLVCGAPNVRVGLTTAWAKVGTTLPDGTVLRAAKIRGIVSEGMLCSPVELGLSDDHSGIIELPATSQTGSKLADIIKRSDVIDVTTHANRFDLLSALGLAREIIGQVGGQLKQPQLSPLPRASKKAGAVVEAKTQVRRYLLQELTVGPADAALADMAIRLAGAGVRQIDPVVDVTNLVLLETGQPLHAFDADKVKLPIAVRFARAGEKLTTLDKVERKLSAADLVIADATGPIGLAGVMGGASTAVNDDTTRIYLESASFDAATIRKMAKRHGLRTEASARFERNLPTELADFGMQRALALLETCAHGRVVGGLVTIGQAHEGPRIIDLEVAKVNSLLGIELSITDIKQQLQKLEFEAQTDKQAPNTLRVTVPWWRPDVVLAEDLVEEIVRLVGYDKIPATIPAYRPNPEAIKFDRLHGKQRQLKQILKSHNLFEVMTYSFVSAEALQGLGYKLSDHLQLKNPLSSEQAYLRSNLLPSLLATVSRNSNYAKEFGVFEMSKVFVSKGPGRQPAEPQQVAVMVRASGPAYTKVKAIFDGLMAELHIEPIIKAKQHPEMAPGLSANWQLNGRTIGRLGQIQPEILAALRIKGNVGYLEFDLDELLTHVRGAFYKPTSKFPSVWRDLTVLVKQSVTWQSIRQTVTALGLGGIEFVGDYNGGDVQPGYKTITVRLEFSDPNKTLTDDEANLRLARITSELERAHQAKIRD